MIFHLGAVWRLYEGELLKNLSRIASASGGSITAGLPGLRWGKLSFGPARLRSDFVPEVVAPIRALAGKTIDRNAILVGMVLPGRVSERVAAAYQRHVFDNATLNSEYGRPRRNKIMPRFVFVGFHGAFSQKSSQRKILCLCRR